MLQRDQVIPVWGTARDGETVTVEFAGRKVSTTAKKGVWRVDLQPVGAGGPFTMTLTGDNTVTVSNLLVGEVWVCSGQSNMEFKFSGCANAAEERPKANYPKIRMFTVARKASLKPRLEAEGRWVECSPQTVNGFSAVGYFFALEIHKKLGVPVGMIHASWGGTAAQAWTSLGGLSQDPALSSYRDAAKAALAGYPAELSAYPAKLAKYETAKDNWEKTVAKPHEEALKAWNTAATDAQQAGQPVPPKPAEVARPAPKPPVSPEGGPGQATALFNGMINPLIPYAIRGTIWYQGEANRKNPRLYQSLFPAMIADWRAKWNQGDFPFLFVQITPHKEQPPEIREAQLLTLAKSPNTAMVVTTDVGAANNIHPTRKQPVGQRLALAARALAYGEQIEYSGPLYQSMQIKGHEIILTFTHAGSGLVAKDDELRGFTIAGANGKFFPANARIAGTNIIVFSPSVTGPKAVRYGWDYVPDVNLFNREGLPASPFRTDVE